MICSLTPLRNIVHFGIFLGENAGTLFVEESVSLKFVNADHACMQGTNEEIGNFISGYSCSSIYVASTVSNSRHEIDGWDWKRPEGRLWKANFTIFEKCHVNGPYTHPVWHFGRRNFLLLLVMVTLKVFEFLHVALERYNSQETRNRNTGRPIPWNFASSSELRPEH